MIESDEDLERDDDLDKHGNIDNDLHPIRNKMRGKGLNQVEQNSSARSSRFFLWSS